MKKGAMVYKGKIIRREVEMLGDVELVRWFEYKSQKENNLLWGASDTEIYDQEVLAELENAYEESLVIEMIPVLPII